MGYFIRPLVGNLNLEGYNIDVAFNLLKHGFRYSLGTGDYPRHVHASRVQTVLSFRLSEIGRQ